MNEKRVFISYSWDSVEHKNWVRTFAERLVTNGVYARLDIWHVPPGESLTLFMEEIRDSDFVVVVCTPNYAQRSLRPKGGVGYEQQIISGEILSGIKRSKFIPILREGSFDAGDDCGLPPHFVGVHAVDFRNSADPDKSFEALLRAILGKPEFSPPAIGKPPAFVLPRTRDDMSPKRLAVVDLDGWRLLSGVAANERFKETFEIPSMDDIEKVSQGDVVKLMFEVSVFREPNHEDNYVERMWVEVTAKDAPYLVGKLVNQPCYVADYEEAISDRDELLQSRGVELEQLEIEPYLFDQDKAEFIKFAGSMKLRYGSKVAFLPEHIISMS